MDKGTTDNFSTRPGEGFQQEAAQAYAQTNGKNAEHQVSDYWVLIMVSSPNLRYLIDG